MTDTTTPATEHPSTKAGRALLLGLRRAGIWGFGEPVANAILAIERQARSVPTRPTRDGALTSLAARMVRATDVCEKPHRNGEANPHVHFDTVHGYGVEVAAHRCSAPTRPDEEEPATPGIHDLCGPPLTVERLAAALRACPSAVMVTWTHESAATAILAALSDDAP